MTIPGVPLFPVTVVGSWPRPSWLLEALRKRQAGQMTFEEFNRGADRAVVEALRYQEEAGVDIVSDGEQRRDNFYSFVVEKLEGVTLMTLAELMEHVKDTVAFDQVLRNLDAPAFAIKNPTVVDKVQPRMPLALDEYLFAREHTKKPIKVTLPGPYLLTRSMWVAGISEAAYPTLDSLAHDIVHILHDELIRLRDAGAAFVQFDEPVLTDVVFRPEVKERTFMCASMAASSGDPAVELASATQLINQVVDGVTGVHTGLHVCRGNWSRREDVLLTGSYAPLVEPMLGMHIDQLVLEFSIPRAGELSVFQPYARQREIGLGVANPRSDEVEPPDAIVARVDEALEYFDPGQVYLNPDCGFGTFAERILNTPDVATAKLRSIAQAAQTLRARY
ncbi:MAG: cobalamin-independent methionine synthase II family protein [Candidatus Latescibacteria bacterium]|nr:cobalamin-independent methionine synthase II family protein [Candidatus Latescibacterota bacterium]